MDDLPLLELQLLVDVLDLEAFLSHIQGTNSDMVYVSPRAALALPPLVYEAISPS